jgi:hypothetical protein
MMKTSGKKFGLLLAATAVLLSSCATSPDAYLVGNEYVGERSVMYLIVPQQKSIEEKVVTAAVGVQQGNLLDFHVRICDVKENGSEGACKQTLVLENVRR